MLSTIGRPVKITCISVSHMDLEQAAALLRQEGALATDLVVLPEYWHGHEQPEPLDGPTIQAIAGAAMECKMYVVCPFDRLDEHGSRLNSAVLIDRQGLVTGGPITTTSTCKNGRACWTSKETR